MTHEPSMKVPQMSSQGLIKVSSENRSQTARPLPNSLRHRSKCQAVVLQKMSKIHVAITKQISETQTNLPAAGELTPPSGPKQLLHFPHTCCLLAQTSCLKKKNLNFVPHQHPLLVLLSSFRCFCAGGVPRSFLKLTLNLKFWNNELALLIPFHQHTHTHTMKCKVVS